MVPGSTVQRTGIAVIGMACRVPGAATPDAFWRNLRAGVESIRTLTRDELLKNGIDPADLDDPHHVAAAAWVDGIEEFDAGFFGFTAREVEVMDPQHRLFLECAWEALEHAGYDPGRYDGAVGVFGGGIFDSYVTMNLVPAGVFDDKAGRLQTVLANEKDYMTTRVSYKLNLRGPSYTVQSGCSTSLVAIHLACQNLLNFESDMALAGGVAIDVSRNRGYWAHPGSVHSPDGHCRAFDAKASGTVFGNGAGMVVLKRLEDALEDGDSIYAVILGSATNNDGSLKVGFTAPSLVGQSKVIVEAMADAGVTPDTIGYVEAHGTGTALGDPIELEAMIKAFAGTPVPPGSCGIGSVKTNLGHLDAAAGVIGFIKSVLALSNRQIPPTLHFEQPNPKVGLDESPFYVVNRVVDWTAGTRPGVPRRAGVSSFGMGGTNAHLVVEEAPAAPASTASTTPELLVLSARTRSALEAASLNLAAHLRETPGLSLADAAWTLQTGRAVFAHRRILVARDVDDAIAALEAPEQAAALDTHEHDGTAREIAFLFPGQGSQYVGMGRALYTSAPVFRKHLDECLEIARRTSRLDLRSVLFAADDAAAAERLQQTEIAQPALFAIEYALARLLASWGIEPAISLGHSIGEYVAACLADVFSLEDAVQLVLARGRLMQTLPRGAMTAVPLPAAQVGPMLRPGLSVAAVNAPASCVVAGPIPDVERLEGELRQVGIESRRLRTSHAFHSPMVEPLLAAFGEAVSRVPLRAPNGAFVSNLTGRPITAAEATDAKYWVRHLREPVRFADGVRHLAQDRAYHFVEVGPGRTLASLVRQQVSDRAVLTLPTLADGRSGESDEVALRRTIGRLWLNGAAVEWRALHTDRRCRVALPTYPFERSRYWIDPRPPDEDKARRERARRKREKVSEWFYVPAWKQTTPSAWARRRDDPGDAPVWLAFADDCAFCRDVVARLERAGRSVITVRAGSRFEERADGFTIDPSRRDDYTQLVQALAASGGVPGRIVHLWQACAPPATDVRAVEQSQERGFYSLLWLAQALGREDLRSDTVLTVVTAGAQEVLGNDALRPEQSTTAGPCLVAPQEYDRLRTQWIDLPAEGGLASAASDVAAELTGGTFGPQLAYRGGRRWIPGVDRLVAPEIPSDWPPRTGGVYLITGGFGHLGFVFAYYLATFAKARLVLVGRSPLPPRGEWEQWLGAHGTTDPVSVRIQKVLALEHAGAEVLVVTADVAAVEDMHRVVAETMARFGALDGVIAAAGVADASAFGPISAVDRSMCDAQFRPKLRGLFALEEALGDRPLDFCMIASSVSSQIGGPGYAPYAAANRFMDAFVCRHNHRPGSVRWLAVNWDAWQRADAVAAGSALAHLAIRSDEWLPAFAGVLDFRHLGQVMVSTADLDARVFVWTIDQGAATPSAADRPTYARPMELEAGYEMPETPVEQAVAAIWQQVLGIDRVGAHDTFLDLGGNSLNAIQVIGRLHEQLGVRVTIEEFIFQTVRQLATICEGRMTPAGAAATGGDSSRTGWFGSNRRVVRGAVS